MSHLKKDKPPRKSKRNTLSRPNYDGAWKVSLERYFKHFLALLFPDIHNKVDWGKGYEFLDGELEKITRNANIGRRYADKLVKVHYKDGGEEWLLIHVEIQGDPQPDFAERMFTYWCLLRIRYGVNPESLAVFTDLKENYRPTTFNFKRSALTTELNFSYPAVKLTDFESEAKWANLEISDNVFAYVVMAQIKSKRLKGNNEALFDFRFKLARSLYGRGYIHEQIVELFDFIGWMLHLPDPLEAQLIEAVLAVEEELDVAHISSVERYGIKKGLEQGIAQGRREAEQLAQERAAQEKNNFIHQLIMQGVLNDEQIAEITGLAAEDVAQLRLGSKH